MKIKLIFLLLALSTSVLAQKQTNDRAKWFTNARFGMFIHWGLYSGAEGIWKGEKHRDDNNYAEWIYYRNRIEKEEYSGLLQLFDWDEVDPEEWVILAKKSGMKYITITAKHHDGFALWDSKVSDYDLGDFTGHKCDIIRELAVACKKHGVKLGLYYSHWVDWEHKFGWDHSKEISGISADDYDQYWQGKVIPQIRELLTGYGEISMMWFDMWVHHSQTVVTKEQLVQLKSLIRELQPNCLINSRLGLSIDEDSDIDFKTMGDNELGNKKEEFPWQSPATVAHSWGFNALDTEWKSTTTLLKSLINNVSLNGNLMLNIGPRANGDVPYEISQRMLEMGKWLDVNGESIYGAEAFDLPQDMHDWGKMTCKNDTGKTKLFLHVFNWPLNKQLNLTGLTTAPDKVYLLADKYKDPLPFEHRGAFTEISLPALQPDPYISVVVIEYQGKPELIDGLVAKNMNDGFSLTPGNQSPKDGFIEITPKTRRGTVPEYLGIGEDKALKWKIYIDTPGEKTIDVSYSFQDMKGKAELEFETAGTILHHAIRFTGKTIGEPNANWVIDNFKSHRIGKVNFPEAGFYDVQVSIQPQKNEEVKFQWAWIK